MEFTYSNGKTHVTVDEIMPEAKGFSEVPNYVYKYGLDVLGNPITAPDGYELITKYCKVEQGFIHFDIYGGWCYGNNYWYQIKNGHSIGMGKGGYSDAMGRWICWARPIK